MKTPPSEDPLRRRGGEPLEGPLSEPADAEALQSETPGLADLIRQDEAFRRDVTRIEAALAQGAEGSPGLYEGLLRCRRISGKLENRIEIVRLQQQRRTGA